MSIMIIWRDKGEDEEEEEDDTDKDANEYRLGKLQTCKRQWRTSTILNDYRRNLWCRNTRLQTVKQRYYNENSLLANIANSCEGSVLHASICDDTREGD
ncbi:hypothetical protein QQP08_023214 [Theobroma cacao]|nr:hypothetical protein QQP08_023214 [Theobroma cacao]